jgi:hypothetical protein
MPINSEERKLLQEKLKNKLFGLKPSRESEDSHEAFFKKCEVPEDMIYPILEFVKINKVLPFSKDVLKKLKDLSEDEQNKIIVSLNPPKAF